MKVIDWLQNAVRGAATYNPEVQVKPACILWPDPERQWEAVVPRLQEALPEMLVLGDYAPERRTGPAIWLRCAIAGVLDGIDFPAGTVPVLYLPGVARSDLRAVNDCPDALKPLAELQYRGTIWSQVSAKDWTVLAFLKSAQGGLGLEVSTDAGARAAMISALSEVLDQDVTAIEGKRLDRDFFNGLLTSGDLPRDVLTWLDQGDAYHDRIGDAAWGAFTDICVSQLGLNPQSAGILSGAEKLTGQDGPWNGVWERFCEAPHRYRNIPDLLRRCQLPDFDLLSDISIRGAWPQWNDAEEGALRRDLVALSDVTGRQARLAIKDLEKQHGARRHLVWSELGNSQLARSLEHLGHLADITQVSLAGGTLEDMESGYVSKGWKADDAVLSALSFADSTENSAAIAAALRSIYMPWAEDSARYLQTLAEGSAYPGGTIKTKNAATATAGECVFFVDGLRFDLGKRLAVSLTQNTMLVEEKHVWSALPSVTSTAKPAVTPVAGQIIGMDDNEDFEASVKETGRSLKGGYHLKKLMTDSGIQVLKRGEVGNPAGLAWTEIGDIDHEGHERGWKLARRLDALIDEIKERTVQLINAGWKSVSIVTDHGWLLLPGGLPKTELPSALAVNKWGRCASIKPGANTDVPLYPWFWNPAHHFALASGISCFRNGQEYTHGGLSLQECLTLHLTVTGPAQTIQTVVSIADIVWKGLRCTVVLDNPDLELIVDIRGSTADPSTSVIVKAKKIGEAGSASVVVENEDLEGVEASLVLVDANGAIAAQIVTRIGGDEK